MPLFFLKIVIFTYWNAIFILFILKPLIFSDGIGLISSFYQVSTGANDVPARRMYPETKIKTTMGFFKGGKYTEARSSSIWRGGIVNEER